MSDGSPGHAPSAVDIFLPRYHILGSFDRSGGKLSYTGELELEVQIKREDLCYAEVAAFASDLHSAERGHFRGNYSYKMYWLVPGKSMDNGLLYLHDDSSVLKMYNGTSKGEFADIFVEEMEEQDAPEESDGEEIDDTPVQKMTNLVQVPVGETYSKAKGEVDQAVQVQVLNTEPIEQEEDKWVSSAGYEWVVSAGYERVVDADQGWDKTGYSLDDVTETVIAMPEEVRRKKVAPAKLKVRKKKVGASNREPIVAAIHDQVVEPIFIPRTVSRSSAPQTEEKAPQAEETAPQAEEEAPKAEDEVVSASEAPPVDKSDDDSEYEPIPECSSGEDSEAEQLRKLAREIRRRDRAKKLGERSGVVLNNNKVQCQSDEEDLDAGYETPYLDSDDDDFSYDEESDGEGGKILKRRKSRWPRYDSKSETPTFCLGMVFRSREQMKKAVINYGIKEHKHLVFTKDEVDKVRAHCSWEGCDWLIYASKTTRNKWLQVSTFVDKHNCVPRRDNRLVTSTVIAKRYGRMIKANPTWKLEHMRQTILEDMFADVTVAQCKRAKKLVMEKLKDTSKGEYSLVFDYQLELLRTNPGSTVAVKLADDVADDMHVFERFYMCFAACKKGFLAGCRKVIGLDGCFFKGACFGQLLCALGRDANNQIYPVAWAVVEKETSDSWFWFLEKLNRDLRIAEQGQGWVFMSDQQKGLISSVEEIFPQAEHRMCARHIYSNWKKKHTDKDLQKRFWRCAKASNRALFNYNRARLAQFTVEGAKDMMNTDPCHWSRAFMKLGSNCDSVDNNMCESFNNYIMESRYLPIVSMLEWIRRKIMVRIQENKAKGEKMKGTICPNIFKKLKINIRRSGNCQVLWNGKDGFEVLEWEKYKYTVNLQNRTCSCRYWQLSGLPCCHAISAIYKCSKKLDDFIADCYSIEVYKKIYDHYLEPLEGQSSWPIANHPRPVAPGYIKLPGRPKKERRREEGEAPKGTKMRKLGGKITCSSCNRTGHNMSSCTNNSAATKHHGQAHVVRERTKKRKLQKITLETANSKMQKVDDDARLRKGKDKVESSQPSQVQPAQPSAAKSRKPTGIKITEPFSGQRQESSGQRQDKLQDRGKTEAPGQRQDKLQDRGKPTKLSCTKKPAPFMPPKQNSKLPDHCVFNLAAYKEAKKSRNPPPV